ncbi:uncharacterized protein LOC115999580 [Ipomoea triloba]|uniref:uncharacterized protein LOC115999580 n=1 Tax=Ipomoea triloba TaxID=35885 RepID=UPI00125D89AD|nr:uncharacterized protein LOC115999580 [Ipomoea triloba]
MEEKRGLKWNKIKLTTEEEEALVIGNSDDVTNTVNNCLVGRVLTHEKIDMTALKSTMKSEWRFAKGLDIIELGNSMALFQFANARDKARVLEGTPWAFHKNLLILSEYDGSITPESLEMNRCSFWIQISNLPLKWMNQRVGERIGDKLGCFEAVEVDENGNGWGRFMRVRVNIDVSKPLRRFMILELQKRERCRVILRYERLPIFCFICGVLGHSEKSCGNSGEEEESQYGVWMKAREPRKEDRKNIIVWRDRTSGLASPEVLDLTEDELIEKFALGVRMVTSFALAISYSFPLKL